MTNRKNYNSILFLTVYLGLVLVGATPQVLAHAATNSVFDLRNEIEFKDDLDKKPDDTSAGLTSSETEKQFFAEYVKLVSQSLQRNSFEQAADVYPILSELAPKFDENSLLSRINSQTNYQPKDIDSAVPAINRFLSLEGEESQYFSANVVYENTKITFQNRQNFNVSCLPRGSIDFVI